MLESGGAGVKMLKRGWMTSELSRYFQIVPNYDALRNSCTPILILKNARTIPRQFVLCLSNLLMWQRSDRRGE